MRPPVKPARRYEVAVDRCPQCPDQPSVPPDETSKASTAVTAVFWYRCANGHEWHRVWSKADLRRTLAKVTVDEKRESRRVDRRSRPHRDKAGRPKPAYSTAVLADEASIEQSASTHLPSPGIYRCPTCKLWHLR